MHHLIPVTCFVAFAFGVLLFRHHTEVAFSLLAGFPLVTFVIAFVHEYVRGIHQFNHQLLHVAYDSSYLLSLLGLCLILRAVVKRKRRVLALTATLLAAIPIAYIFTTQP